MREHELRSLRLRLQTEEIDGDESTHLEHKLQEFQQQAPLLESLQRELSSAQVYIGCVGMGIVCVKVYDVHTVGEGGCGFCKGVCMSGLHSRGVLYLICFSEALNCLLSWEFSKKSSYNW